VAAAQAEQLAQGLAEAVRWIPEGRLRCPVHGDPIGKAAGGIDRDSWLTAPIGEGDVVFLVECQAGHEAVVCGSHAIERRCEAPIMSLAGDMTEPAKLPC
jgi:hypothetical protein